MSVKTSDPVETVLSIEGDLGPDARLALVTIGPSGIHEHDLPWPEPCLIGRAPPAHVCIDDPSVSRTHARLLQGAAGPVLQDLGSRNGTYVNNERLGSEQAPISPGNAIRFGSVMAQIIKRSSAPENGSGTPDAAGRVDAAQSESVVRRVGDREIIVADPAMVQLFRSVQRVVGLAMPVLITGETGSGKEIVSEAVHALGPRAGKPLVKLNCAAMPENLLESELFGFERGAFSGAVAAKPGQIEQADGGTLFLDEIGEMPLPLQAKILRVVEDRRVMRLGASKDRAVDLRFVAATHRDLRAAVAEGRFREDLFYRLSTLQLRIPPLRERPQEIVLLAQRFAAEAAAAADRSVPAFTEAALRALMAHSWPGNVRELRNVISQAVVFCEGDALSAEHLGLGGPASLRPIPPPTRSEPTGKAAPPFPPEAPLPGAPASPARRLDEELRALERARIVEALEGCGGNQTKAAELLQMPRRTLVSRMTALGIPGRRQLGNRGS